MRLTVAKLCLAQDLTRPGSDLLLPRFRHWLSSAWPNESTLKRNDPIPLNPLPLVCLQTSMTISLATWGKEGSLEKTLMLGKIEGSRRRGWQKMRWLDGITDVMDMSLSTGEGNGNPFQYSCLENPKDRGGCWGTVQGVAKSWTRLSDWTELNRDTREWTCEHRDVRRGWDELKQ